MRWFRSWLVLATLALVLVHLDVAYASRRCPSSCRSDAKACRLRECGGLDGDAKRDCVARCQTQFGCPTGRPVVPYVVTRCRTRGNRQVGSQELRIRRGRCDPVTVLALDNPNEVADPVGLCRLLGQNREGFLSGVGGVFQRLGLTPDARGLVFEINNAFQLVEKTPLAEEQMGFFFVRTDGTGLRRLGPPSKDPAYRVSVHPSGRASASVQFGIPVSPGGLAVFTDRGMAPGGQSALQLFTLDIATGERRQVTSLPAHVERERDERSVSAPRFVDNDTIQFKTRAYPGGPEDYTIRTDGTDLRPLPSLPPIPDVASPNPVVPSYGVNRATSRIATLTLNRAPVNVDADGTEIYAREIFRLDQQGVIQLTNFGRFDTAWIAGSRHIGPPSSFPRILFYASADPLGENPYENCQLFSMSGFGGGIRQLTHFHNGVRSSAGCQIGLGTGCAFGGAGETLSTGDVIFYSDCNPNGANPDGSEIFTMFRDDRHIRKVTHTAGVRRFPDGEIELELPGPMGWVLNPIR